MFKIGQFSRIARVTTRQLRYYDECGLLQPEYIDHDTGYRYYTASQLPRLNQILALKDLGLSLDQIARFLDEDVSADELRGMLAMKKAQLEQVVEDELLRIQQIAFRIDQLETEGTLQDYDVIVQSIPDQRVLSVRTTVDTLEQGIEMVYEINRLLPMRAGRAALGHLMLVMHSEDFRTEEIDVEIGFQVKYEIVEEIRLSNGLQLTMSTLPGVEQMATIVREGLFNDQINCYGTLGRWIDSNGYEIDGNGREVFMQPLVRGKEDQIYIEMQLPVKLVDAPALPS